MCTQHIYAGMDTGVQHRGEHRASALVLHPAALTGPLTRHAVRLASQALAVPVIPDSTRYRHAWPHQAFSIFFPSL